MKLPILLVYLTALIVGLSYGMHNPIVPVFSKEIIGASYFELGIIGLTNFLPYMFIPLFVGILLDKFNNGLLLSAGITLNTASIYLLSISQSVPEIAFFRALTGMAHAFFWPPCERIISQVEDPENRVKSIARFMGFFVGGLMIGPVIVTMLIFCSTAFGTFLTIYPAFMNDRSISESNIELLFFIFGISRLVTLAFVDHGFWFYNLFPINL